MIKEMVLTLTLEAIETDNSAVVGAKAAGLQRLMKAGIPVPHGFCVTGAAYRRHISSGDLPNKMRSALEKLHSASADKRRDILSILGEEIRRSDLPGTLADEIADHYHALDANLVAVRSSATAEDMPGHSFAGQYDTYLGVQNLPTCLSRIKDCWASLWTERAFEYRERNGFDHISTDMAVIVQSLVPADASGVLFTADPISGDRGRVVIEACFGLGEALVSGKVTPDRIVIAKDDLRIVSHSVSAKMVRSAADGSGNVNEHALDEDTATSPCIDAETARRLADIARKAEMEFGFPLDMEWAVAGKEIYFLQSRPITTLPKEKSWEDRQVWSNLNTGEVLPDVVTPLTWSLAAVLIDAIFTSVFGWLGMNFKGDDLIGRVAGRGYFNLNSFVGIIRRVPGLRNLDLAKTFGGRHGKEDLSNFTIPDEDIPDFKFNLWKMVGGLPVFLFKVFTTTPSSVKKTLAALKEDMDDFSRLDLKSLSDDELSGRLSQLSVTLHDAAELIMFSGLGMFYFSNLDKICRSWLADEEGTFANRLLAGMGDMDSAEAGLSIWRLAKKAHGNAEIERAILAAGSWQSAREGIAESADGREFLCLWDGFMARHGHHTRGELELYNPRWSESPDYILDTLKNYLRSIGIIDPIENHLRRGQEREDLIRRCRGQLKNPVRRKLFDFVLGMAQSGCVARENLKSLAVRYFAMIRAVVLEMAFRLEQCGILDRSEDIFFLSLQEIDAVRVGRAGFDVKETIAARRREYERNLAVHPPSLVIGRFDPDNFIPDRVDYNLEVLQGLAVSPGLVTGPARVILKTDAHEQVLPGEILVAPFTDPGWTPYFLPAAAIVMDQGGILSHGSIVAREYGIPAVVNVGPATRLIKTGQTIQVDGTRGLVRIFPASEENFSSAK